MPAPTDSYTNCHVWPTAVHGHTKLYGSKENLRTFSFFHRETGEDGDIHLVD